ncbi:MAG: PTS transporter subunit EIIC [Clostridiales bacterium]|jgi:PTS system cellobiose-specific IIC component|nr:PTS transporter subunit EIIC [Clostridiales bacterium]
MEEAKLSFKDKAIERFTSIAGVIGRNRQLGAIRDGFVALMPLMILGSIAVLINGIPLSNDPDAAIPNLSAWLSQYDALKWIPTMNGALWDASFGFLAFYVVAAVGYNLAKVTDSSANALGTGITSLASFIAIGGGAYSGSLGLFVGIIVALISGEIYIRLSKNNRLLIKMPQGVPPAVAKSFAALFPTMITVAIFGIISALLSTYATYSKTIEGEVVQVAVNIVGWFNDVLQEGLLGLSGSYGFGFIIVFLTHFLWLFGLHGANITDPVVTSFTFIAIETNLAFIQGAGDKMIIMNKVFLDTFVYMGGSGVGLGIVIAMFVASKSKAKRTLANLSAAPAAFNINEPVIFGLPIVLNPIFAIPFILGPIVCFTLAYIATAIGWVNPTAYITPWTTPPILSGLFATGFDWRAPILQLINLAACVVIYFPFIKIADNIDIRNEAEAKRLEAEAALQASSDAIGA